MNANGNTAYNSGSTATYTVQAALIQNTTYYIRAYAKDPAGSLTWSSASTTITFTTGILNDPTNCVVNAPNMGPATITWTDNSLIESNYYIETSSNGGAFTASSTLPANAITSSQPMYSGTYQYRVRAGSGGQYSNWCTTGTVTYYTPGDFLFNGLQFNLMQIQ
jgi:hypothetical protein